MEDISIDARMHVKDPSVIQLYSCSTPNGIKVAACLEELVELRSHKEDFTYEAHTVDLRKGETRGGPYALIAPHGKIPALVDPCVDGPDPITVFESGAILVYLAEKYAELLPCGNSALRAECLSWTFWGTSLTHPSCVRGVFDLSLTRLDVRVHLCVDAVQSIWLLPQILRSPA
jgi:glutathione S-transferase